MSVNCFRVCLFVRVVCSIVFEWFYLLCVCVLFLLLFLFACVAVVGVVVF